MSDSNARLDFPQVETLRRYMMVPKEQWAFLLGVTRATYHSWTKELSVPRRPKEKEVIVLVQHLTGMYNDREWPLSNVGLLTGQQRYEQVRKLLQTRIEGATNAIDTAIPDKGASE